MVGDDVVSDIGGAQDCGIRGILVRTGKYRPCDEKCGTITPFHVANNLFDAVNHIINICDSCQ
jgi:phospholysine phosphohistidine inorganic pyrophosphate phosphatase